MKDINIYNLQSEFINDNKYKKYFKVKKTNRIIWIKVKAYIKKNNKNPSCIVKNRKIQKLAYWVTHNYRYYRQH